MPVRAVRIINSLNPASRLENTDMDLESVDGDFICVENCVPICMVDCQTPPPTIPFSRYVWSIDGLVEAPAGIGLAPGRAAAHSPAIAIDTDSLHPYLSGYSFEVTFTDGLVVTFDYDADVEKEIGSLYEKYPYYSSTPTYSWNRPVDFYEFISPGPTPSPVPGLSPGALFMLVALAAGAGRRLIRSRPDTDASGVESRLDQGPLKTGWLMYSSFGL